MNTVLEPSLPRPWAVIAGALPGGDLAPDSARSRDHAFTSPDGAQVQVEFDETWIGFAAPPGSASARPGDADRLTLLAANAALPAGVKYALRADGQLRLCTECPVELATAAPQTLRDRFLALTEAASAVHAAGPALSPAEGRAPSAVEGPALSSAEGLRQALAEGGWNCLTRPDGRLAVDLEIRAGFYQAELVPFDGTQGWPWPAGGWRLSATLLETDALPEASRRALGFVLLRAAEEVRLVRPTFVPRDGGGTFAFETMLPPKFRPQDVADALSSLAAACGLCGEEVKWLCQEQIAKDCLALGLGNPASQPNQNERRDSQ